MSHVYKIRVKRSVDTVPKGFEVQVVSNSTCASPTAEEVQKALIAAGFPNVHCCTWSRSNYDIISRV